MQTVNIIVSPDAGPLVRRAASELREYLAKMWRGHIDPPATATPVRVVECDVSVAVGLATDVHVAEALRVINSAVEPAESESFSIRSSGGRIVVAGRDDHGVLYGVYQLLESLGARFYLSGTSLPRPAEPVVPDLHIDAAPAIALRGYMPYTDFLTGPSTWDGEDYVSSIDAAARLRLNLFSMHFYTFEPIGQFEFRGRRRTDAFWDTSRTSRWRKKPGR